MVSATAGPAWTVSKAAKGAAPKRWDGAAWPKAKRTDRTFDKKIKLDFFFAQLHYFKIHLFFHSHLLAASQFFSFFKILPRTLPSQPHCNNWSE